MPDCGEMGHQKIARFYRAGMTQSQIAAQLGRSQTRISQILRELGIACRDQRHLDWPHEDMKRWYLAGETVDQIATRLGRSRLATNKVLRKIGTPMRRRGPKSGSEHPGWKGGRTVDKHGYILVYMPGHLAANSNGYIREHRLVAEQMIGRPLTPGEVVHHKNDNPADNRPENLQVFDSNRDHLAATLQGKIPQWTEEGLARIAEGVRKPRRRKAISARPTPDDPASPGTMTHSTA